MTTPGGPLHSMPLSHELDDQTVQFQYKQSEVQFAEQIEDAMRVLHGESADNGGRVLSVVIHPWMSGQPHRIAALAGALSTVMAYDGVWSASGSQILEAFEASR
jgi:hypothetical protein